MKIDFDMFRLTNEQYLIVAGLFQLLIAVTSTLIGLANYDVEGLDIEVIKSLKGVALLKLKGGINLEPKITWGLAGFNLILFFTFLVIWKENEKEKKPRFGSETFGAGLTPFGLYIMLYFFVEYENILLFALTGSFAVLNLMLLVLHELNEHESKRT